MTGQEIYVMNYERRINGVIDKASKENKLILVGYRNHIKAARSISTQYNYVGRIDQFLKYIGKSVKEISYDDYIGYLTSLSDKSSTYQIAVYTALELFSKYLKASNRNKEDAMQFVECPKVSRSEKEKKAEKRLKNVLHDEEIQQYIKNVEYGCGSHRSKARQEEWKERDLCIIQLFLTTGMRCSAMYRLNVNDIDMEHNCFKTVEKRDKIRTFYFPDKVRICLDEWLLKRKELLKGKEEDALFISCRRCRLEAGGISEITKKYGVDIKNTSPHKLRATFGTQLLDKTNGDLDKVRIAMGHNSVTTTELYMRRDEAKVGKEVADLMAAVI